MEGINIGQVKGASISRSNISRVVSPRENRNQGAKVEEYYGLIGVTNRSRMLEQLKVIVFPEDHVEFFPEPTLGIGSKIVIYRAYEVVLNDNGQTRVWRTWAKTIGGFFKEKNIIIYPGDIISQKNDQIIYNGLAISIRRSSITRQIERIKIPNKIIIKEDPWLPFGKVKIIQQGELGEKQIIWDVIFREGKEVKRQLAGYNIIKPIDKLVYKGTKPVQFRGPYYDWILEAAERFGADPDFMYRVMMCESGGDPYAISPSEKYKGLYQYDELTWSASGFGDHDRFDPWAQINAAAKAWDSRYTKWPVTSRVCGDMGR